MERLFSLPRAILRSRHGDASAPRFLTYLVTFACNARCIMCSSYDKPNDGELDVPALERILARLPRMDAVRLSGGEPFLRKDFGALARVVEERLEPFVLHVTTNGFLTRRIVHFVEERTSKRPLRLLLSVDGYGEKHDRVRGRSHAWSRVEATLRELAPRRRELGFELDVNMTIVDRESIEHYRLLRDHLRSFDVRIQVVFAYEESATYSIEPELELAPRAGGYDTFGSFERDELERFLDELERDTRELSAAERLAKRYYLAGLRERLLPDGPATRNPPCVALGAHLRLDPDGTVPTCQMNSKRAGDLRAQTWREVRATERYQRQRGWVEACVGCWAECEVLPSAFYTGDLFREVVPSWFASSPYGARAPSRATAVPAAGRRVRLPLV